MSITVAVTPDPVATLRALLLSRSSEAGDTTPVIRSTRAPGEVPPFTLLRDAGEQRPRSAPVLSPARVNLQVFETTSAAAAARYRRFAALVHRFGPVIVELEDESGGDVGVWRVFDETGPQQPIQEPDTKWWTAAGVFDLYMSDRAVG